MIKTTLVGHACLLIQSKETTILTDPVWFDYLWEEINTLCPSIVLEKDKVPPLDVLNISHRHQDHFDVRTLAYLVKNERILTPDTLVLAPQDNLLLDILNELEFKNIKVVTDFESIQVKDVTITPTPSRNQLSTAEDSFPEHGLLVNDGEVTIWNQVDSLVNPDIIQQIGELYGQIDFFHSRFVPLIEGNFSYNKPITLPTDEYCTFLNVVKALGPRFVVPGSAAFRYRDELTFLNQYSFPTTQDQFLSDLALFCPEVPCAPFFSGDVAHISSDKIHIEKQASDFVRVKEDDSHLVTFKPNSEVPPIKTQTTDPEEYKREMKVVDDFIENCLLERVLSSELLEGWQHWQIVYQLEVFGQDGPQAWTIDFGQPGKPRLHKGEIGKINLYEGISSAELCALVEGNTSWDYVTLCGNYRTFNNIYRITDGRFELPPEDKSNYALEPLMDIFPWDSDMDRRKFMRDVKRWKDKPVR
jgi:UDP-MurNAc hydroxylase